MHIHVSQAELDAFCRRRYILWLAVFGSALRDDFRPDSDVDLLVQFAPGHTPGLDIVDIEDELSAMLGGRKVDIVNPKYLNRRLRDHVLASAETLYAQG